MPKPLLHRILTPEKALIFRITHKINLPWILRNGLHCSSSRQRDPQFVTIGNPELIARRRARRIPVRPGGTLDDYIAFDFTPCSPMLYNISTGYGGITQRSNEEVVVLVSSLPTLRQRGIPFVFTDRHAYLPAARFFSDLEKLEEVDEVVVRPEWYF